MTKPSEVFEGENSSLKQAYNSTVDHNARNKQFNRPPNTDGQCAGMAKVVLRADSSKKEPTVKEPLTTEEQVEEFEALGVGNENDEIEAILDILPKVDHETEGLIDFGEWFKKQLLTAEKRGEENITNIIKNAGSSSLPTVQFPESSNVSGDYINRELLLKAITNLNK